MNDQKRDQGVPQLVSELWELVVAYFKQEAVEPFKALGKFIAYGLGGALALSLGVVVLLAAVLRLLQTETGSAFHGNLSPLPYVITLATGVIVAALAARAIVSGRSSRARG